VDGWLSAAEFILCDLLICLSHSGQPTRVKDCKWHPRHFRCLLSVGFTDLLGPFISSQSTK